MLITSFSVSALYFLNNTTPNALSGGILVSKSSPVSLCSLWVFPGWLFLVAESVTARTGLVGDLGRILSREKSVFVGSTLIMKKEPDVFKLW